MPSIGAPSDAPCKPGISIFRPRSLIPCARSSIQSLRLSRSSRMPRRRSWEILFSWPSATSSTKLRNQSSSSRSSLWSSMGLPSNDTVIDPSACSISRIAPLSSIFGVSSPSSMTSTIKSSPKESSSGAGCRMLGIRPGVIPIIQLPYRKSGLLLLLQTDECPLVRLLYLILP